MVMKLPKSWHNVLQEELNKDYIHHLKAFLEKEKQRERIYPPEELVFNAFRKTTYEKVKVVLVGQDPYHGEGQAEGLSFSVPEGVKPPPSLVNIYKELETDLGIPRAGHGSLVSWAEQGVLLLNATLTVRELSPKSHHGRGWEVFTDKVIEILANRKDPIVFMLWGKSAQEKGIKILNHISHPHKVLISAHPSPFSAHKFFGCKHFSKANDFLAKFGKTPIRWNLS